MLACIIANTMQKEAGKNIEPFFFNNIVMKKGRGPATPFWAVRHARQISKISFDDCLHDAKRIMQKYSTVLM